MPRPRLLGVLLCYNDGDILVDSIRHLLANQHHVIVWNHGSIDDTGSILKTFRGDLLELREIDREVSFYDIYPLMSQHLLADYVKAYDWISWPDQDEFLEGPTRGCSYRDAIAEVYESPYDWIQFRDFVYWHTELDDPTVVSPCERVRHYALSLHGLPKIRSWRATATNCRWFNHNRPTGRRYPGLFNLRHYPMRSQSQMERRLLVDRAGLQRGPVNFHYESMKIALRTKQITSADLHRDDGRDLDSSPKYDWCQIYGTPPELPRDITESFLLSTKRWQIEAHIAAALQQALTQEPGRSQLRDRISTWLDAATQSPRSGVMMITLDGTEARIVSEELARDQELTSARGEAAPPASESPAASIRIGGLAASASVSATERRITVAIQTPDTCTSNDELPLVCLVPYPIMGASRVAECRGGLAEFDQVGSGTYVLAFQPATVGSPVTVCARQLQHQSL